MKCTRCGVNVYFSKSFYTFVWFFFSSLENYFGLGTTNVKGKMDHPVGLRSGIKSFGHFQRSEYFDCAFSIYL